MSKFLFIIFPIALYYNSNAQASTTANTNAVSLKSEIVTATGEDPEVLIDNSLPNGIMLYHTKMVIVKNGVVTPIEKDVYLANGTKIRKDGFIFMKNKPKLLLNLDEYIDASGKILPIKKITSSTN